MKSNNRIPTEKQLNVLGCLMIAPFDTIPFRNGKSDIFFADRDGEVVYIKSGKGYIKCWLDKHTDKSYMESITSKQFKLIYED